MRVGVMTSAIHAPYHLLIPALIKCPLLAYCVEFCPKLIRLAVHGLVQLLIELGLKLDVVVPGHGGHDPGGVAAGG